MENGYTDQLFKEHLHLQHYYLYNLKKGLQKEINIDTKMVKRVSIHNINLLYNIKKCVHKTNHYGHKNGQMC